MTTKFMVNGEEREIKMRDANGIDWSGDFIGNTAHGMDIDDEGRYIASEEDYTWWANMIDRYQAMEAVIAEYRTKYSDDVIDELFATMHTFDCDLEDQPDSVERDLKTLDEPPF